MDAHVNVMKCIVFDAQLNGVYSDIYFINIAITYNFLLRLQLTCKTQKKKKKKINLKI